MLTAKQVQAVQAVLTCRTMEDAAEQVGVTSKTLRRWRSEVPEFDMAVRDAADAALADAANMLKAATRTAVRTLAEIAADEKRADWVRMQAAAKLMEHGARLESMRDADKPDAPTFIYVRNDSR